MPTQFIYKGDGAAKFRSFALSKVRMLRRQRFVGTKWFATKDAVIRVIRSEHGHEKVLIIASAEDPASVAWFFEEGPTLQAVRRIESGEAIAISNYVGASSGEPDDVVIPAVIPPIVTAGETEFSATPLSEFDSRDVSPSRLSLEQLQAKYMLEQPVGLGVAFSHQLAFEFHGYRLELPPDIAAVVGVPHIRLGSLFDSQAQLGSVLLSGATRLSFIEQHPDTSEVYIGLIFSHPPVGSPLATSFPSSYSAIFGPKVLVYKLSGLLSAKLSATPNYFAGLTDAEILALTPAEAGDLIWPQNPLVPASNQLSFDYADFAASEFAFADTLIPAATGNFKSTTINGGSVVGTPGNYAGWINLQARITVETGSATFGGSDDRVIDTRDYQTDYLYTFNPTTESITLDTVLDGGEPILSTVVTQTLTPFTPAIACFSGSYIATDSDSSTDREVRTIPVYARGVDAEVRRIGVMDSYDRIDFPSIPVGSGGGVAVDFTFDSAFSFLQADYDAALPAFGTFSSDLYPRTPNDAIFAHNPTTGVTMSIKFVDSGLVDSIGNPRYDLLLNAYVDGVKVLEDLPWYEASSSSGFFDDLYFNSTSRLFGMRTLQGGPYDFRRDILDNLTTTVHANCYDTGPLGNFANFPSSATSGRRIMIDDEFINEFRQFIIEVPYIYHPGGTNIQGSIVDIFGPNFSSGNDGRCIAYFNRESEEVSMIYNNFASTELVREIALAQIAGPVIVM